VAVDLGLERLRNEVLQVKSQEDWLRVVTAFAWEISVLVRCDQCIVCLINPETKQVTKYLTGVTSVEHQEVSQLPAHLDHTMETGAQRYRPTQEEVKRAGGWDAPEVKCATDTPFLGGVATLSSTTEHAFGKRDLRVIEQFAQVLSASSLRLAELKRLREKEEQLHQAQRLQALGQLAAGVAHSFNDLLQGIIFNTDLCLDPSLVTPHKECLEDILSCSLRGAELAKQLMLFEGYHPLAATAPIALGKLVDEVVSLCRSTFDRRITFSVHIPQDLPEVRGDVAQLREVLLNLLVNARDALEQGHPSTPLVQVQALVLNCKDDAMRVAVPQDQYVCLQIKDNGPGMDPATQTRIFEPFFTTKEQGKGLGLGLSVCYAILRDHDGWIECASAPGGGTLFSWYLPAVEAGG
jgi:signal transduction histidine kinase